jgi:hypothetical protein
MGLKKTGIFEGMSAWEWFFEGGRETENGCQVVMLGFGMGVVNAHNTHGKAFCEFEREG